MNYRTFAEAPPIFGWAAITLSIGPHSSYELIIIYQFIKQFPMQPLAANVPYRMSYVHIDSASGVFKISESKGGRSLLNSLTVVYECGGVAYVNVVWRIN